ncbi:hypothetical protein RHPLAN_49790 [Rhodoplanes sp. Z2-YC6860]|nr:hypothetical protein RHPLAN_49790 [Rhodoplanes sp. Z2-YC6860]
MVAALRLPINDLPRYFVLLIGSVAIFASPIQLSPARWFLAIAALAVSFGGPWLWPAPRIEEGHNVFVTDDGRSGALERGLPADAFRQMKVEFDARYPRDKRCAVSSPGCWRNGEFPTRPYAFSADAIFGGAEFSRRVTRLDFSDPLWQRLGFINEGYNWYGANDLQRNKREPRWKLLHPWAITMPYFVMIRLPGDFAGSRLCWRGLILWETEPGRFESQRNAELDCHDIQLSDAGRMIFGVSIGSPLEMHLQAAWPVRLHRAAESGLALLGAIAILLILVQARMRAMALPLTLIGLALLMIVPVDASFIGGWRPFDGGDDGLWYESVARKIVQSALAGDDWHALEGGEAVYYYGGPGLRYLRALERFLFGDTPLGYLSLMLVLPLAVFAAFKRFFTPRSALGLTLIFIALPVGTLFGSTYIHYVKWAARGFADPAAAMLFVAALVVLIGRDDAGPDRRFGPAFGAGLLFALALWVRPNLAPAAGILLGGAGLAALWQWQVARLVGMCIGFLPVLGMALHNWVFGHEFVLFSSNATITEAIPMPPSAYVAAFGELLRLDLAGEHVRMWVLQWARWLAGPSESFLMIPLNALAIVVLIRVAILRSFDPWLRLIAAASLVQHTVAWFYLSSDRYYYLVWFLTLLVCAVWVRDEGFGILQKQLPGITTALERHPARVRLERVLDWFARLTGIAAPRGRQMVRPAASESP